MTTPNDAPRPTSELVKRILNEARPAGTGNYRDELWREAAATLQSLEARNKELEGALEPFTVKPGPLNSWLVMEATARQHSNWVVEKDARDEAAKLNARAILHPATKTGE